MDFYHQVDNFQIVAKCDQFCWDARLLISSVTFVKDFMLFHFCSHRSDIQVLYRVTLMSKKYVSKKRLQFESTLYKNALCQISALA